jgi:hypothetical protein
VIKLNEPYPATAVIPIFMIRNMEFRTMLSVAYLRMRVLSEGFTSWV